MKTVDAIALVLSEAGGPLHYQEITHQLLARNLWSTTGKTPQNTIYSRLLSDPDRFILLGSGVWKLTDKSTPSPPQQTSDHAFSSNARPAKEGESSSAMSYLDAAEEVLRREGKGQPMHYVEIVKRAIALGLLAPKGETPANSFSAQLGGEIKKRRDQGKLQRFERVGGGLVRLFQTPTNGLPHQIEQHNQRVRVELKNRLHQMDAFEFENRIGELLGLLGFQEVVVTSKSNDGGIDVRGTLVVGDVIHVNMAVQVKRWTKNVQAPVVQQVRGSLGTHDQGLIITTSDFSAGAKEEASRSDAPPVRLMNGEQLVSLLTEYQIGVKRSEHYVLELALNIEPLEA